MTRSKSQKNIRLGLVIALILLIFMPAQIPILGLKIGFIVGLGLVALALQIVILRQTSDNTYATQGKILMALTVIVCAILLLI